MPLEDFRPMMERCSSCSYCKWIPQDKIQSQRFAEGCPSVAFSHFNTYSARGRFQLSISLLEGRSTYSQQVMDVIHQCTTCGSCDVSDKICRYNLEPLQHNLELKARAIEDGNILPAQQEMMQTLKKENTMMPGQLKKDRGDWAEGLNVKRLPKEKAKVLFFAGCRYSYDQDLWDFARSAVNILVNAGIDLGIYGAAENCCGSRAYQMGFREESNRCAMNNIKAWQHAGVKTIVTPCSDCYYAFKRLYPELGADIEVLHTVEYIERLIQQGKIKFTNVVPLTVTYHDPCHLGRQGEPYVAWEGKEKKIHNQIAVWEPARPRYNGTEGIYDAPRNILASIPGVRLVEMERIREYAWCCGAGSGCDQVFPEFSAWTAGERIAEANATGAEAIVTACPWCERNFINATTKDGNKMEVLDIIELVQRAL